MGMPLFQNISIPAGLKAQIKANIVYMSDAERQEIIDYFLAYNKDFQNYYVNSIKATGQSISLVEEIPFLKIVEGHTKTNIDNFSFYNVSEIYKNFVSKYEAIQIISNGIFGYDMKEIFVDLTLKV